jgi:hypothetical protein
MVHLEARVPAPVVFGLAAMLTPHIRPHELARRQFKVKLYLCDILIPNILNE